MLYKNINLGSVDIFVECGLMDMNWISCLRHVGH